jgi:hypothetical protein
MITQCAAFALSRLLRLTASASRRQAHEDLEGVVYHPLQARKRTDHLGRAAMSQYV